MFEPSGQKFDLGMKRLCDVFGLFFEIDIVITVVVVVYKHGIF